MERKKNYEQPQSTVTRVELESPICSGSVVFGEEEKKVDINSQQVTDANNDFSGQGWEIDN